MIKIIRKFKKTFDPDKFSKYCTLSFSQEGEDIVLKRVFEHRTRGFYVDVGAHHPKRFSNTYLFYKNGWRGINIDARPGSMELFRQMRPNDINIEAAISDRREELIFYQFNEPAVNTFSKSLAEERLRNNSNYYITGENKITTNTLTEILEMHLPVDSKIDFLSVDVEGLDVNVISSLDFKKFKPELILIEALTSTLEEVKNQEINILLENAGYYIFAKTLNTVFYKKGR